MTDKTSLRRRAARAAFPLYITAARGGEGAVREAVEFLLAARMDGKNPADLWTAATGPAKV